MNQSAMDKRYGGDGKRTNICFTCNKSGNWARSCPNNASVDWITLILSRSRSILPKPIKGGDIFSLLI